MQSAPASVDCFNLLADVLGVDDRNHAVELKFGPDPLIDEKSLNHRSRIGESCGFDHEGVKLGSMIEKLEQTTQQVAPYGATDATVAHFDDLLIR